MSTLHHWRTLWTNVPMQILLPTVCSVCGKSNGAFVGRKYHWSLVLLGLNAFPSPALWISFLILGLFDCGLHGQVACSLARFSYYSWESLNIRNVMRYLYYFFLLPGNETGPESPGEISVGQSWTLCNALMRICCAQGGRTLSPLTGNYVSPAGLAKFSSVSYAIIIVRSEFFFK